MYDRRPRCVYSDHLLFSLIQRRTLAIGFATGSVEGRIAVEFFDPSQEAQDKKYAFKCHRQTIEDVDHVWPVNALAFHPIYNTFASAGSDGTVSIWDYKLKKRLRQYPKYHSAIPSVSFNCDGTKLAIGVSYVWDEGEQGARSAQIPSIYVRRLGDEAKVSYPLHQMNKRPKISSIAQRVDGLGLRKTRPCMSPSCTVSGVLLSL